MSVSGSSIIAMLTVFWGLVFLWFHIGLLAIIGLAALADLTHTAVEHLAGRPGTVEIRRRNGS
jgi:hypothetical protein